MNRAQRRRRRLSLQDYDGPATIHIDPINGKMIMQRITPAQYSRMIATFESELSKHPDSEGYKLYFSQKKTSS